MSEIVDQIAPGLRPAVQRVVRRRRTSARAQRSRARSSGRCVEAGVKVFLVTHMFDLAQRLLPTQELETALFLRAERQPDGERTFRLVEGEPLATSYGADSYRRIFGSAPDAAEVAVADTGS